MNLEECFVIQGRIKAGPASRVDKYVSLVPHRIAERETYFHRLTLGHNGITSEVDFGGAESAPGISYGMSAADASGRNDAFAPGVPGVSQLGLPQQTPRIIGNKRS